MSEPLRFAPKIIVPASVRPQRLIIDLPPLPEALEIQMGELPSNERIIYGLGYSVGEWSVSHDLPRDFPHPRDVRRDREPDADKRQQAEDE